LYDVSLCCEFAELDPGDMRLPDESTRYLLEEHNLGMQLLLTINATLATKGLILETITVVVAPLLSAPSSAKNSTRERGPKMDQTKKGNRWHLGMKGVDADSGLWFMPLSAQLPMFMTSLKAIACCMLRNLLCSLILGTREPRGEKKLPDAAWQVARRPGNRKVLDRNSPWDNLPDNAEEMKVSMRAKVGHPFLVIKCKQGSELRRILAQSFVASLGKAKLTIALSNLWMARRQLMGANKHEFARKVGKRPKAA